MELGATLVIQLVLRGPDFKYLDLSSIKAFTGSNSTPTSFVAILSFAILKYVMLAPRAVSLILL